MKRTIMPPKFQAISVPMLCIGEKSLALFRLWLAVFSTADLPTTLGVVHRVVDSSWNAVLGRKGVVIQRTRMS
jgi:hypothetical protein